MTANLTTVMACTQIATLACLLLVQQLTALSAAPGVSYDGQPVTPLRHEHNTATTTTKTDTDKCDVTNTDEFLYNKIRNLLEWKTKLINYDVSFVNYSTNPLLENTTRNYKVRGVLFTEPYTCLTVSPPAHSISSQVRFLTKRHFYGQFVQAILGQFVGHLEEDAIIFLFLSASSLCSCSVPWLREGLSMLFPHLPILRYPLPDGPFQ